MLAINRRFTLITYPDNRDELVKQFEELDIVIDETHYKMNLQCNKILRVVLDCHVASHHFEDVVKFLETKFKEDWASLIY